MTDPFHSSKYMVSRAKHHVADFEREFWQFFKSEPYSRTLEIDPNTSEEIHKLELVKPMPVALPGLAFDAVNNLRSALDNAAWAVGAAALKSPKFASFPFAKDATHFENAIKGRCKDLPASVCDLIRTFKPYKGGDNLLWALNELCNTDKHAIVCPIAVCTNSLKMAGVNGSMTIDGTMIVSAPKWDRTKNEMILYRMSPGGKLQANLKLSTYVAICDVEIVDGQPAVAVLKELIRIVDGIVMAIEAETRRLGLIP